MILFKIDSLKCRKIIFTEKVPKIYKEVRTRSNLQKANVDKENESDGSTLC